MIACKDHCTFNFLYISFQLRLQLQVLCELRGSLESKGLYWQLGVRYTSFRNPALLQPSRITHVFLKKQRPMYAPFIVTTRRISALLGVLCLLAMHRSPSANAWDLFGKANEAEEDFQPGTIEAFGPVVFKTLMALRYTLLSKPEFALHSATAAAAGIAPLAEPIVAALAATDTVTIPIGAGESTVVVRRDGLNELFVSFQDAGDLGMTEQDWATTSRVPWLESFVYTAEAPTRLLEVFSQLTMPVGPPGAAEPGAAVLVDAIEQVMKNERVLWVTCTGEGAGGGLAILCGVASSLYFPATTVDVITFGTPWLGFNPQFAWAFDRLVNLYYLWPFDSSTQPPEGTEAAAENEYVDGTEALQQLATGGAFGFDRSLTGTPFEARSFTFFALNSHIQMSCLGISSKDRICCRHCTAACGVCIDHINAPLVFF
jgi:hypothetical protein